MAAYNGAAYIRQAIDSALSQTFGGFELLIIDDGSTDESVRIVEEYTDPRIRLLRNQGNLGLFRTRKRGVEEARGKYFATLDCDDMAPADRLNLQLSYFKEHPDCVLCGGRIKYIDTQSRVIGKFSPVRDNPDHLRTLLLFTNIFSNSTTMIETELLREFQFRHGYEPAEDFDVFERIAEGHRVGFINSFLAFYRVHNSNVSTLKQEVRKRAEREIIGRQLKRLGFEYAPEDMDLHMTFTTGEFDFGKHPLGAYAAWLNRLKDRNRQTKVLNTAEFDLAIARQWVRLCRARWGMARDIKPLFQAGMINYRTIIGLI